MSTATYDVIIVGAGIVGAACAEEFARQGLRVAVLDCDGVGGGATAAGMGHIVVMDDSEAQFALTHFSQQLWQQLRPELPADVEYEQVGTIWVAADEEEMAEVHRKETYYHKRGVPVEVLDANGLRQAEPNLREGMAGGLLVPQDGVLYPPCGARFLMERAIGRGAKLHLGPPVKQLGNGKVRLANGTEYSAGILVNAAGAWSTALTPGVGDQEAQRPSGDYRSLSRLPAPSVSGARLFEERAFVCGRIGCIQRAAAEDRPDSDRLLATIRRGP